jgi:hypothetical protein
VPVISVKGFKKNAKKEPAKKNGIYWHLEQNLLVWNINAKTNPFSKYFRDNLMGSGR